MKEVEHFVLTVIITSFKDSMGSLPGGGGQGLVGVPVLGGNAGGTSSFLAGGSSNTFLVMITLFTEPVADEIKGSSVFALIKNR